MPVDQSGYWVPPITVHPPELNIPHPSGYIYQSAIPEVTTQTPGELLNEYYSDRANVRDWTDPNGVLRKQQEVYCNYPQNVARPIGSSGLIGIWPRPNRLRAEPVPVYGAGSVPDGPEVVVEFRNWRRERPSRGISVVDIHRGSSESLDGVDDIVLDRLRGKDLKFIIAWPGYRYELSMIHTRRETDGGPLTRFDLAQQITTAYGRFFKKVEEKSLLPSEVGFYNIALHQGQNAKYDSLGVQLLQLYLVKFRNTIDGFWVAEVEVV